MLREAGLAFEPVLASTKTHKLADGTDYYTINPKGYVPLLELDNGERLTEGPAIVQYIADQVPAKKLAPAAGTMARYRLQEWLNFITTELHKGFGAAVQPGHARRGQGLVAQERLLEPPGVGRPAARRQAVPDGRRPSRVADAYLFTVTNWAKFVGIDISALAHLGAFMARMAARPAVQEALKAEGPAEVSVRPRMRSRRLALRCCCAPRGRPGRGRARGGRTPALFNGLPPPAGAYDARCASPWAKRPPVAGR